MKDDELERLRAMVDDLLNLEEGLTDWELNFVESIARQPIQTASPGSREDPTDSGAKTMRYGDHEWLRMARRLDSIDQRPSVSVELDRIHKQQNAAAATLARFPVQERRFQRVNRAPRVEI